MCSINANICINTESTRIYPESNQDNRIHPNLHETSDDNNNLLALMKYISACNNNKNIRLCLSTIFVWREILGPRIVALLKMA